MQARSSGEAVTSAKLPGVSISANGQPMTSLKAWILLVQPIRERPIACASVPFFGESGKLCLDKGAADGGAPGHRVSFQHCVQELEPKARAAFGLNRLYRSRWLVGGRVIRLTAPRPEQMDDARNHSAIINALAPGWSLSRCGSISTHASSDDRTTKPRSPPSPRNDANQKTRASAPADRGWTLRSEFDPLP